MTICKYKSYLNTILLSSLIAATLTATGCDKTPKSANGDAALSQPTDTTAATTSGDNHSSKAANVDPSNSEPDTSTATANITNTSVNHTSVNIAAADADTSTAANSQPTNPALPSAAANVSTSQPSLITNPVTANTPEATLKVALDTLYYGDAKDAAKYYQVDMANFSEELAKTQYAFQQTVEAVTITNTIYNKDKTRATIEGELMLKGQSDPAPLTYTMQKINGKWKILG